MKQCNLCGEPFKPNFKSSRQLSCNKCNKIKNKSPHLKKNHLINQTKRRDICG